MPTQLGNAVEKIAKPIAKQIDKVFHTDLEHCESCEEVKRLLNDHKFMEATMKRLGMTGKGPIDKKTDRRNP